MKECEAASQAGRLGDADQAQPHEKQLGSATSSADVDELRRREAESSREVSTEQPIGKPTGPIGNPQGQ